MGGHGGRGGRGGGGGGSLTSLADRGERPVNGGSYTLMESTIAERKVGLQGVTPGGSSVRTTYETVPAGTKVTYNDKFGRNYISVPTDKQLEIEYNPRVRKILGK